MEFYKGYARSEAFGWVKFSALEDETSCWLKICFTEDEVYETVCNMNGDKVLRPDGFAMAFF